MKYSMSVDIGGTTTRVAFIDEMHGLHHRSFFPTNADNPQETVLKIKKALGDFNHEIVGAGISCPGPLDTAAGIVLTPPNLFGWHGFKLASAMETIIGVPAVVDNDANLACLAESICGAGQGLKYVQYFAVSTGIGGGFVVNGDICHGAHGFAQEIANVIVQPKGQKVGDLQEGSLESLCSGTAITYRARQHGLDVKHAGEVNDLALAGNYAARMIIEDAKEYLGNAVAAVYGFFDPDIVILGGGVALKIDGFVEAVEQHTKNKVNPVLSHHVKVSKAKLGDDAGLIGGGILALKHFQAQ